MNNVKEFLQNIVEFGAAEILWEEYGICDNLMYQFDLEEKFYFQECVAKLKAKGLVKCDYFPIYDATSDFSADDQYYNLDLWKGRQLELRKELAKMVLDLMEEQGE